VSFHFVEEPRSSREIAEMVPEPPSQLLWWLAAKIARPVGLIVAQVTD